MTQPNLLEGRTALVLEDELIIAFALEDLLEGFGARVVLASTVAEAEAHIAAAAEDFGLAVLDVNVHGKQSYGVAERLAASSVPLIFATGYGTAEHPPRFAAAATLTKPYNRQQLADAIAAVL